MVPRQLYQAPVTLHAVHIICLGRLMCISHIRAVLCAKCTLNIQVIIGNSIHSIIDIVVMYHDL